MRTKSTAAQFKSGEDGGEAGTFTAYASVFGNVDSYGEIVMPGAFKADLERWAEKGDPIPLLFGHNMSDPDFNIGHIVKAEEDDVGLKVHAQLDLESPKGGYVHKLLKERRVSQMSFAFDVLKGAPAKRAKADGDGEDNVYELHQLKLHEVSVVPLGANQETDVLSVKAVTDLLADVKAGRALSSKNEESLRGAYESIGQVLDSITPAEKPEKSPAASRRNLAVADALSVELSLI